MARVTVADDVLSGQPEAVHEIDYVKLVETGVEELHLEGWRGDVRFLITPPEPAERFWYVQRPRTLTTTTGVPYFDITYLRPDQTWTYDPREALRLPQQERMRAFSIVQDFRAQGVAHSEGMYAVLLTVAEADVRHPMPPEEIRAPE